ncbi:MAG: hypothetical protein ABIG84_02675, partial [archaeon]
MFILMLSLKNYTGYVTYGAQEFEGMKIVEVNVSEPNASVFIQFKEYQPLRCKDGILVIYNDTGIDFVTYNETHENGTCMSATVLFRNRILAEDVTIRENITSNQTQINDTYNYTENQTHDNQTAGSLTFNDNISVCYNTTTEDCSLNITQTNDTLMINQTYPDIMNATNTTYNTTYDDVTHDNVTNVTSGPVNTTQNITIPMPSAQENS